MNKLIIPVLFSVILVSGCLSGASFTKSINMDCSKCNNNVTDMSDCMSNFEENKNSPVITKVTGKLGIDMDKINVTKVEKTISYPSGTIACKYYFEIGG